MVLAVVPLAAGCATSVSVSRPELTRLFAGLRQTPHKEPVIIIPGALGSILCDLDASRLVWGRPGRARLEDLALPIDEATWRANRDRLTATGLLTRVQLVPHLMEFQVNRDLFRVLGTAGGYTGGDLDEPKPGSTCFLFSYDWRRDLVEAAQQLGAAIERLASRLGEPNLKVHLVCQSAGGLVARYYVKYGTADVLDQDPLPPPTYAGAKHVAQVIMLGTPNNGSLQTFQSLHEGLTVPGAGRLAAAILFTMPAAYELLPHEDETVFLDERGQPLDVSLWEPAHWQTYGWSVFSPAYQAARRHEYEQSKRFLAYSLARAHQFHRALDHGNPADDPVEYLLLGSDCQPTPRRALLVQEGMSWHTRFATDEPTLQEKLMGLGDGSVTKESLLGSHRLGLDHDALAFSTLHVAYAVFVCETHRRLTENLTILDNLLQALMVHEANAQHAAVCLYCQQRRLGRAQKR